MRSLFKLGVTAMALLVALPAQARTKQVSIAGGEKVKVELKGGMPVAAKKDGIEIDAAAFGTGPDGLAYGFGLTCSTPTQVTHIKVENVTGPTAEVLVDDTAPAFKRNSWFEKAKPVPITREHVPWLFTPVETMLVFRFTVTRGGQDTVLYQAAVFPADTKSLVLRSTGAAK